MIERKFPAGTVISTQGLVTLSIIVPAYNEQEVIVEFHNRLSKVLKNADIESAEIIYVNDGSIDGTLLFLQDLMSSDDRIHIIDLSRNFGKEAAMTAGFDAAQGQAVIILDADLQDPPELIPLMLKEWRSGYDMVLMRRRTRMGETWFKKSSANLFYHIIQGISQVDIPKNVGDFRLLSRPALTALNQLPERIRFMKGLFAWIGFPTTEIYYDRDQRYAGVTKWNYWKLWNFALEGISSFTTVPLRVASYVGMVIALGSLIYGLYIMVDALLLHHLIPEYPSIMVAILFLGGLQLLAIGIIGEYLGRMFIETKLRPVYLVKKHYHFSEKNAP